MHAFDYHRPTTLAEAQTLVTAGGKPLAGGMTLLPSIKQDLATPSALVDLSRVAELGGERIRLEDNQLIIGALTPHAEVARSPRVHDAIPALAVLAEGIGDTQVRHCGTIGGSLANHDPAADYPAALLGLGGRVRTSKRVIDADDFFTGLFGTALAEDELLLEVQFPLPEAAAYVKFAQPASRYALVGVFVARTGDGVRVAVTGAGGDGVFRAADLEACLTKDCSPAALDGQSIAADHLLSDLHGSADYRASLVVTLAKRAVAQL